MKYGSVCSGIEAATVAWHPLGMKPMWFSEIEQFPSAVLKHHYPKVENLGDMTRITERKKFNDSKIDVLVGGTPCQSFSVAGLRKGLEDPRGNLALVFLGIVNKARPRWVVWENVPGVLSSNKGKDFGAFVGGLAKLGYGWAFRVLDAQYFGVPQRRRRVFVVGHLGDWRPAAAVLFELQSLSGHPAPSRKKGPGIARSLTSSTGGVSAKEQQTTFISGEGNPLNDLISDIDGSLQEQDSKGDDSDAKPRHLIPIQSVLDMRGNGDGMSVRRLTPRECERLQGFPDDYTLIPWNKKIAPDGPRYKALGNSMAVPVMRWIGERIMQFEKELKK